MYQYLFNKERPEEDESWDIDLPIDHPLIQHLIQTEFPAADQPDPVLIIMFDKGNPNPSCFMQPDKDTFNGIVVHPKCYESIWYLTVYGLSLKDIGQAVRDNDHTRIYRI